MTIVLFREGLILLKIANNLYTWELCEIIYKQVSFSLRFRKISQVPFNYTKKKFQFLSQK